MVHAYEDSYRIALKSLWEESLAKKPFEKMGKYDQLVVDLREGKHHEVKWTVIPLCVDISHSHL